MGKLCHYTNADALIKILSNMQLKLSTLEKSRDLKERNYYQWIIDPINGIATEEAKNRLKMYRFVCFCRAVNDPDVYPLDKGYKYPFMWDTYADKHKGACIVLDEELFEKENPHLTKINIKYRLSHNIDKLHRIDTKLRYKTIDWAHEREVRFIFSDKSIMGSDEDVFCNIGKSVSRIYLGVDFDIEQSYNKIEEAIRAKRISPMIVSPTDANKSGVISPTDGIFWDKLRKSGINFEEED